MGLSGRIKKTIHWRRVGWVACLVLASGLVFSNSGAIASAINQARSVRALLSAGEEVTAQELANPFVCLRDATHSSQATAAMKSISDPYLRGVSLCMAGETESGLAVLQQAGSNGRLQVAAGLGVTDAQAGLAALQELGLSDSELGSILLKLIDTQEIDPYALTRQLARVAGTQPATWVRWLQLYSDLNKAGKWQEGLAWLAEGLLDAPQNVRSSLMIRVGSIYQYKLDPRDPLAALDYYNQALEIDGWLYPSDEAAAHQYRGEVYRTLKDRYSMQQALQEFERALQILPGSYWALLDLGDVYLKEGNDIDQAEAYYRQAISSDDQSPYAYYYLGGLYQKRGDSQSAAEWYRKALEKQPGFQPALDRLSELSSP